MDVNVAIQNVSELVCKGGLNSNLSLFVFDTSALTPNISQSVIIAGRRSNRFGMQIVEKRLLSNKWLIFECVPISSVNISLANVNRLLLKDVIGDTLSTTFTNEYNVPFPGGNINLIYFFTPTLTYSFDYDFSLVDLLTINYVNAQLQLELNVDMKAQLDLTDIKYDSPTINIVKDKTLKDFVVILGGLPIPGRISLDLDNKVSLELKDTIAVKTSFDARATGRVLITSAWTPVSGITFSIVPTGPNLENYEFHPDEYKENGADVSLTVKNTLTPTVTATIPSVLSESDLNLIASKLPLPDWLKNSSFVKKKLTDYIKLSVSVDVPLFVKGILKLCSVNCINTPTTPLGVTVSAGSINFLEKAIHVVNFKFLKKFIILKLN